MGLYLSCRGGEKSKETREGQGYPTPKTYPCADRVSVGPMFMHFEDDGRGASGIGFEESHYSVSPEYSVPQLHKLIISHDGVDVEIEGSYDWLKLETPEFKRDARRLLDASSLF